MYHFSYKRIFYVNYGRKLTTREYEQAIISIYTINSHEIIDPADEKFRKQELFLTIDHNLGIDFPLDKREKLWQIQQRTERNSSTFFGEMNNFISTIINPLEKEYIKAIGETDTKAMLHDTRHEEPLSKNQKIKI